jgi:pyrroline-5-carboxylate reductase
MKIAIFGAGNVGGTLGKAWAKKDHDIFFGVRHPQDGKTQQLVQSIGGKAQAGNVKQAAAFGEVVVLATPWPTTEADPTSSIEVAKWRVSSAAVSKKVSFDLSSCGYNLLQGDSDAAASGPDKGGHPAF